jgi:Na+/melibiose symporter-like transporter
VVFAPKAWDVVLNPVAGRISDRSTSPRGRRRPFLLAAGTALAASFALLFAGPTAPPVLAGLWVALLFLACATAYAFFQVPYVAMPAEMTGDADERTRLMTGRVVVLALAILVSGAGAPLVVEAAGWSAMGAAVAVVLLLGAVGPTSAPAARPRWHPGAHRLAAGAAARRGRRRGLPVAAAHLRRPGAGDRGDARRRRVRRAVAAG